MNTVSARFFVLSSSAWKNGLNVEIVGPVSLLPNGRKCAIHFEADGTATIILGTRDYGQGFASTYFAHLLVGKTWYSVRGYTCVLHGHAPCCEAHAEAIASGLESQQCGRPHCADRRLDRGALRLRDGQGATLSRNIDRHNAQSDKFRSSKRAFLRGRPRAVFRHSRGCETGSRRSCARFCAPGRRIDEDNEIGVSG